MFKRIPLFILLLGMVACPAKKTMVRKPVEKPICRNSEQCRTDGSGPAVAYCVSGNCVRCRYDGDCPGSDRCTDGRCAQINECPCPDGAVCDSGKCVDESSQEPSAALTVPEADADSLIAISEACRPLDPTSGTLVDLSAIRFEYDNWLLSDDARAVLDANADCLREVPSLKITVEGHCDERGTPEYNLGLGEKRANVVREYLEHIGVPKDRLLTVSMGEERPICGGADDVCWSKNRRVELIQNIGVITSAEMHTSK